MKVTKQLTDEQRMALGLTDEPTKEELVVEETTTAIPAVEIKKTTKKKSEADIAREKMLATFNTEITDEPVIQQQVTVDIDELLKNVKIDVSNFEVIEKSALDLMNDASIVINGKSTYEVVCNQSAYIAHLEGLTFTDLSALENSAGSYYAGRQRVFKTIYEKINSTSIGKLSFDEFLKTTSLYDMASLIYGVYCQTFKTEAEFTIGCPHCEEKFLIKVPNKNLICIKDEETYKHIQTVVGSVSTPEQAYEASVMHVVEKVVLPESKYIFEVRIPSLYKYLDILGSVKPEKFEEVQDILGMLIFVDKVYKLDVAKLVKDKKVAYYEIFDRGEKAKIISELSIEDTKAVQKIIKSKTEKHSIDFAINKFNCNKCSKPIEPIPIDIEEVTFFRLEQM